MRNRGVSNRKGEEDEQRLLTEDGSHRNFDNKPIDTERSQIGKPGQPREEPKGSHAIYPGCQYIKYDQVRIVESEMNSNLPLQILIYFNFFFSVIFFLIELYSTYFKHYSMVTDKYRFIHFPITVVWPLIEIPRLYFGYSGNIRENFPEMVAFMIMTVFFALPVMAIRVYDPVLFPIDTALFFIYGSFMLFEAILGAVTISTFVRTQTALFYLRNLPPEKINKRERVNSSRDIQYAMQQRVNEQNMANAGTGVPNRNRTLTTDQSMSRDASQTRFQNP